MTEEESWSTYAVEEIRRNPVGRRFYHSFLMLVNDTTGETLKELHFSPWSAKGRKPVSSLLRPLNLIAAPIFDKFGRLAAFKRAADKFCVGRHITRINGVQTSGRRKLEDVSEQRLCFTGSPAYIMSLWNTACRVTIALNKTDTPFLIRGFGNRPGLNCRSGTELLLESLGKIFNALTTKRNGTCGIGRHLRREIEGLDEIHYNPENATRPLADLQQENKKLGAEIYYTRPQERYRQPRNSLRRTTAPAERLC